MGFAHWLRSNSEHYLAIDAQRRVAQRYGAPAPRPPKGLKELLWLRLFAPVYRLLPWGLRRRVIAAMPGSHRRDWPVRSARPKGPAL